MPYEVPPVVPISMPRAAYVHVPFCRHRCGYCNFTLTTRQDLIADYVRAIERELAMLGSPRQIDTLFFGGGTPSLLPLPALQQLIDAVQKWWSLAPDYEWSIEVNPEDASAELVQCLQSSGVNRVSLGVQSFQPDKLHRLDRHHSLDQIEQSYHRLRAAIDNVSIDLIFAAPGESLEVWQADLRRAVELCPDHISTYGLTIEKGTPFWSDRRHHRWREVPDDLQCDLYNETIDRLSESGWNQYEVSNFARPGRECRHNRCYWSGRSYYAVGPGAARYVDGWREVNHRSTTTWLRRILNGESAVAERECLSAEGRARELAVLGLRMREGIAEDRFRQETGFELNGLLAEPLAKYEGLRWLEHCQGRWRVTRAGLPVSDAMWPDFLTE